MLMMAKRLKRSDEEDDLKEAFKVGILTNLLLDVNKTF